MGGFKGGYGGFGGGNMQQLMNQAKKMQEQMANAKEQLDNAEIEGKAGGDSVIIKINGSKVISGITIKPEVVDPDDVEMLEDLILAAINDAYDKAEKLSNEKMGGFNLPKGLF